MKRDEVQNRFDSFIQDARARIEKEPLKAFGLGIVIGVLLALFHTLVIPLLVILAIVAAAFYFFSEVNEEVAANRPSTPPPSTPPPVTPNE